MAPLQPWLREGLRAAALRPVHTGGAEASPGQLVALLALNAALSVGLARLEIAGGAQFDLRGWLFPYWVTATAALLARYSAWLMRRGQSLTSCAVRKMTGVPSVSLPALWSSVPRGTG